MLTGTLAVSTRISNRRLRFIFLSIAVVNFMMLWGTTIHNNSILNEKEPGTEFLLQQFNLALENVIAAWYSSMLLLSVAVVAGICYVVDSQRFHNWKERTLNMGWLALCGVFTLLSFDEIGSFHEIVDQLPIFKKSGFGDNSGLNAFYVLVGMVGLFMLLFFWVKFRRSLWAFLFAVAGAMLFLSHPVQEAFEWHLARTSANPDAWRRPNIMALVEEGSEIFGSLCFLISFTIYSVFATSSSKKYLLKEGISLEIRAKVRQLLWSLVAVVFGIGFAMLYLKLNPIQLEVSDSGIPRNWFPSAISFIAALATLYFYFDLKRLKVANGNAFLFAALMFFLFALYYGSNIYANSLLEQAGSLRAVQTVYLFISVLIGLILIYKIRTAVSLIGTSAWILLSFAIFGSDKVHASEMAYVSLSFFLITCFLSYLQIRQYNENSYVKDNRMNKLKAGSL